jgi:hypothetical protein
MPGSASRRLLFAIAIAAATGCAVIAGLQDPTNENADADAGESVDGPQGIDATNEQPSTCVADLASDPKNCGACGHDCAGGDCSSGRCVAIAIVTEGNAEVVRAVTANDTHVYWANSTTGRIQRIGVDGSGREEVADSGATQLAIDSTHLYFTSGGLRRLDLGTRTQQTIAAGTNACIGLDPDGVHLYGVGANSTIIVVQKDGGDLRTVLGPEAGVARPWGVAATSTDWYWSQGLHLEPDGSILRRARPNGPTTPVHLFQLNPNCILIADDGRLYWPNADQGSIHRSELDGASYETLATAQDVPTQVAVTSKFIYWNNGNKVMRLAR